MESWLRFVIFGPPLALRIRLKMRAVHFNGTSILRNCFDVRSRRSPLTPKISGHSKGLDLVFGPPRPFIATPVKLAVVQSADRDDELIAYLSTHRALLGKFDVVGVGRSSSADQARPRGNKP